MTWADSDKPSKQCTGDTPPYKDFEAGTWNKTTTLDGQ